MVFRNVATDAFTQRMITLRHHIVLPLMSLLIVASLAAPSLHTITHFAHEPYTPYKAERTGYETPVFDTEGCEVCVLNATLVGIEFKAISVSPAFATQLHSVLAPQLIYALLSAPANARAPPAIA